jgi:hypothetical protein
MKAPPPSGQTNKLIAGFDYVSGTEHSKEDVCGDDLLPTQTHMAPYNTTYSVKEKKNRASERALTLLKSLSCINLIYKRN